jgi:SPP1 gp7 family putative phage head morphogenesis protein
MAILLRRSIEALRRAVLGMGLARFAKQAERTDAADGSGPPRISGADAVIRAAKAAAGAHSSGLAAKVDRHNRSEFKRLGIDVRKEPKLGGLIDGWRASNVERVTSLLEFERDELADILSKGWGKTVDELRDRIEERIDVSRSKADLLARDQVLTLNAQITQERHKAAGIEAYIWTTANDERVRDSHEEVDGEKFYWDDPPEIDGERVHPGEPINCRCVPFPILPELDED